MPQCPMPILWEFAVAVESPQHVRRQDVHWLVSGWLDCPTDLGCGTRTPAGLPAARIHCVEPGSQLPCGVRAAHGSGSKAWAVRRLEARPGELVIQIAVFSDDLPVLGDDRSVWALSDFLAEGILRSLDGGFSVGPQRARTAPRAGQGGHAPLRLVARQTWDELCAAEALSAWRMVFETPTTFDSGGHAVPYPLPPLVFEGLARRWNAHAPAPLKGLCELDDWKERVTVVTTDHHLDTTHEHLKAGQKQHLHFTGDADMALLPRRGARGVPVEAARRVGRLLALSRYTGVGYEALRGYGTVSCVPL